MLKCTWIKELNIKLDTPNLIEEKVGKKLELLGTGGNFINRSPMAHALRSRIYKWDLMNWKPSVRRRKYSIRQIGNLDLDKYFHKPHI